MFTVTKQWILEYSTTGSSGWTRDQLAILGYSWPPPTGWLEAAEGIEITPGKRVKFEFLCNREAAARKKADDAVRHQAMQEEVYYTWPIPGGWTGSWEKPKDWPQ